MKEYKNELCKNNKQFFFITVFFFDQIGERFEMEY